MKKNFLSILWMLFLVTLLLGFLFWGIFCIDELQSKIAVFGIVAIILTAFTSVLIVSINNKKAKEREYDLHILKEKQKVFEHFYNAYFESMKGIKNGKKGLSAKATSETMEFKKGLMNWGSHTLIKKYLAYENKLQETQETFKILEYSNDFVKALREELDFKDSKDTNIISIILTAEARKEFDIS